MKFASLPPDRAEGAILAYSLDPGDGAGRLKKGRVLGADDVARLGAAGIAEVHVATLEPGDIPEDEAAARIAEGAAGAGVRIAEAFTGRANLFAAAAGLVQVDAARLAAFNAIDESLTIATLRDGERVAAGQMIATIKIIPFAVTAEPMREAAALLAAGPALIDMAGFASRDFGLILTRTNETADKLLAKRERVTGERIAAIGGRLGQVATVPHTPRAIAEAVTAMAGAVDGPVLVFGAAAIVDRGDVVPAGIAEAGGALEHLGMPVDPGNLLLLARLGGRPVIGVPSCASSIKPNGFDWVLERLAAGLDVTPDALAGMGHGGLLKEIASRPQPRERAPRKTTAAPQPQVGAVVLAAGRSSRMGARNKLLEPVAGEAMVRRVVKSLAASHIGAIVVVTGHEAEAVRAALAGLEVHFVHNPHYRRGLSASLAAGINAIGETAADGALICLGDMPNIARPHIDRLVAAFAEAGGRGVCVPMREGRRGNPVLWPRALFDELRGITGDTGARHLIATHTDHLVEVPIDSDAIFEDVDTPEALRAVRG